MKILGYALIGIFILGILSSLGILVALGKSNLTLVQLLKASICDSKKVECRTANRFYPVIVGEDNRSVLSDVKNELEEAIDRMPGSSRLKLHLAEVEFSLGNKVEAGKIVSSLNHLSLGRSPLLDDRRYEYHLIKARQHVATQDWRAAVDSFLVAQALGGESVLSNDYDQFFNALANLKISEYLKNPQSLSDAFLAGKYLVKAGKLKEGKEWLERISSADDLIRLDPKQTGQLNLYLGMIYDQTGDYLLARSMYEKAIALDPANREAHIRLLKLLRMMGAEEARGVELKLAQLGPGYIMGVKGSTFERRVPASVPGGWTLVGYDLDDELLETTSGLDLLLWWKSEGDVQPDENMIQVGEYWLQWSQATNLYPNAGFEWGADINGLPRGDHYNLYNTSPNTLQVVDSSRNGLLTRAIKANNTSGEPNVSLASRAFSLDPNAFYLMGGWIWGDSLAPDIGRNCYLDPPNGPYYISRENLSPHRPVNEWVHVADLAPAYITVPVDRCQVLLMNYNTAHSAMWDDVFLIKVIPPQ